MVRGEGWPVPWHGDVIKTNNNCRGFQLPCFKGALAVGFLESASDDAFITWRHRRHRGKGPTRSSKTREPAYCVATWSFRERTKEMGAPPPFCRHSSPLTFTSSTLDGGQILIQLGRINQITMTPCCPPRPPRLVSPPLPRSSDLHRTHLILE